MLSVCAPDGDTCNTLLVACACGHAVALCLGEPLREQCAVITLGFGPELRSLFSSAALSDLEWVADAFLIAASSDKAL